MTIDKSLLTNEEKNSIYYIGSSENVKKGVISATALVWLTIFIGTIS